MFFFFSIISGLMKIILKNWIWKSTEFQNSDYTEKNTKDNEQKKEKDKREEERANRNRRSME